MRPSQRPGAASRAFECIHAPYTNIVLANADQFEAYIDILAELPQFASEGALCLRSACFHRHRFEAQCRKECYDSTHTLEATIPIDSLCALLHDLCRCSLQHLCLVATTTTFVRY